MRSFHFKLIAPLAAVALFAAACSSTTENPGLAQDGGTTPEADGGGGGGDSSVAAKDIVDTAVAAGSFKTLVSAVQAAGLESTLRGAGPFTVFAPNDDAFKKSVPDFLLTKLVSAPYKTELGLILKYHVLSGKVAAADVLGKNQSVDTVAGAKLGVDGSGGMVKLNGGTTVTTADVAASNGVIHIIDGVLLPTIVDTASKYVDGETKFSTLVTALTAAGLVDTLNGPGPFTVFAPTDKAFADLKAQIGDTAFNAILADKAALTNILTYHVVSGAVYEKDVMAGAVKTVQGDNITIGTTGGVTINESSKVVFTDLPNRNGVIHVIDKVLLPPEKK